MHTKVDLQIAQCVCGVCVNNAPSLFTLTKRILMKKLVQLGKHLTRKEITENLSWEGRLVMEASVMLHGVCNGKGSQTQS